MPCCCRLFLYSIPLNAVSQVTVSASAYCEISRGGWGGGWGVGGWGVTGSSSFSKKHKNSWKHYLYCLFGHFFCHGFQQKHQFLLLYCWWWKKYSACFVTKMICHVFGCLMIAGPHYKPMYQDCHHQNTMAVGPYFLYNGNHSSGKMMSLYRDAPGRDTGVPHVVW